MTTWYCELELRNYDKNPRVSRRNFQFGKVLAQCLIKADADFSSSRSRQFLCCSLCSETFPFLATLILTANESCQNRISFIGKFWDSCRIFLRSVSGKPIMQGKYICISHGVRKISPFFSAVCSMPNHRFNVKEKKRVMSQCYRVCAN